jgi:hypothetical protein
LTASVKAVAEDPGGPLLQAMNGAAAGPDSPPLAAALDPSAAAR